MRSKWHTLAVIGSLGFFASWNAVADDTSPTNWTDPSAARAAARSSSAAANPGTGAPESHRIVDELVRQALVELDANRFDTARRLAQRAAAISAATGIVSTRPEQLIAEIDRKQRRSAVVIPTAARRAEAAPRSERSHKAEAIQLLDHGIMALDQKRFDEAENCADRPPSFRSTGTGSTIVRKTCWKTSAANAPRLPTRLRRFRPATHHSTHVRAPAP